jgi:hypothetical protein
MKPFHTLHTLTALVLLLTASLAFSGDTTLEIIQLKHRSAQDIIPFIKPILEQGDMVTGSGYQLIVRARMDNLIRIQEIIQRLDTAPKRLLISVKQVSTAILREIQQEAKARISNQESRARVRIYQTQGNGQDNTMQQIQVLEGNSAYIRIGHSIPVGERNITAGPGGTVIQESIRYKDLTTGFYVAPRVSGTEVTLYINPHKFSRSREHGGVINLQEAQTTLRGPLGEWLLVAGSGMEEQQQGTGYIYRTQKRGAQEGHILVKAELLQ